jgi:hypothetical protein
MWPLLEGRKKTGICIAEISDQHQTTPAKMLARNEGLKDICHSITGGALVAQGKLSILSGYSSPVVDLSRLLDSI